MRRRWTAVAAALLVLVTSCSGEAAEVPEPSAKERVEVFSWWTGLGEADGLKAMRSLFEKQNPGFTFVDAAVEGGSGDQARALLASKLQANQPPDTFQGHAGAELQGYITAGKLEPLNFLYDELKLRDAFPPQLVEQISVHGDIYSIPVNIHRSNVLWFNPKVLDDGRAVGAAADHPAVPHRARQGARHREDPAGHRAPVDRGAPLRECAAGVAGDQGVQQALDRRRRLEQRGDEAGADRLRGDPGAHRAAADRLAAGRQAGGRRRGRVHRHGRLGLQLLPQPAGRRARQDLEDRLRLGGLAGHVRRLHVALGQFHAAARRPQPGGRAGLAQGGRQQGRARRVQPAQGLDPGPPRRRHRSLPGLSGLEPGRVVPRRTRRVDPARCGRQRRLAGGHQRRGRHLHRRTPTSRSCRGLWCWQRKTAANRPFCHSIAR